MGGRSGHRRSHERSEEAFEKLENHKKICIDTDVLIDFLKKKEPSSSTYEHWRNKAAVVVTSITAFELLFGSMLANLRERRRYDEALSLVEQHSVLPFDKFAAEKASEIGAELRRTGKVIEIRDLFNASICVSQGIPILTRNKGRYQRVAGLALLDI